MYVGDYKSLIPFSKVELKRYIKTLKNKLKFLKPDESHYYSNLEIILLKTGENLLNENKKLKSTNKGYKQQFSDLYDKILANTNDDGTCNLSFSKDELSQIKSLLKK